MINVVVYFVFEFVVILVWIVVVVGGIYEYFWVCFVIVVVVC